MKNMKLFLSILIAMSILTTITYDYPAYAEDKSITSEILDIRAEDELLIINVAKKYPNVTFTLSPNIDKLLIELLDTTFHTTFSYNEETQAKILVGLDFISNVDVKAIEQNGNKKVSILLLLKPNIELSPKILSTKDNLIKLTFLKPKVKEDLIDRQLQDLYNRAVDEQSNGRFEHAISLYKEIISKNPKFYLAKLNLANAYIDTNNHHEGISLLLSLIEEIKSLPAGAIDKNTQLIVLNTLGTAYFKTGYYDDGKKQFLNIINIDPSFYQAYYNIGLINEKQKEIDLAYQSFQKVISLRPDLPEAYYHTGVLSLILNRKDSKDEAIKSFEKVIQLAPKSKVAELSKKELNKIKPKSWFKRKK